MNTLPYKNAVLNFPVISHAMIIITSLKGFEEPESDLFM